MFHFSRSLVLGALSLHALAAFAEPELYETGPSEEVAYVRFVNATDKQLSVASSNGAAKISLGTQGAGRVSRFYRIKAGTQLGATFRGNGHEASVRVSGKPWEYITVAALTDGASIKTVQVKDTPDDFNALRASLALFNLDSSCGAAAMQGGAKNVSILNEVKPYTVQRRLLNPVKLTANISCNGKTPPAAIEIPQMQAGERYSVFLLGAKAGQAVVATDSN